MSLASDRPEFAPPPQRGTPRAVVFALLAHVVLIAALIAPVHCRMALGSLPAAARPAAL